MHARAATDDEQSMLRKLLVLAVTALVRPASALAGGGDYSFEGAKPAKRSTVRAALNASAFDWSIVPQHVTIHVGPYGVSHSTPGDMWLDGSLLGSGRFAWATVMDDTHGRVRIDAACRVSHSAFVARRHADRAHVQQLGLRRSGSAAAPSRPPASGCRPRAWPSLSGHASAPSQEK
jgi:hypothetical protein